MNHTVTQDVLSCYTAEAWIYSTVQRYFGGVSVVRLLVPPIFGIVRCPISGPPKNFKTVWQIKPQTIFAESSTFRKLNPGVRFNFRKNEGFFVKFTERTLCITKAE